MRDQWWKKRTIRTVDNLKLWPTNPRLEESIEGYSNFKELAASFVENETDKKNFRALVNSIVERGFEDFDPVVTWKNDKDEFVVAEGNRRVLALKLLRNPNKSPQNILYFMKQKAASIDRDSIEKIDVLVAPDYDSSIIYIIRRHTPSAGTISWDRSQVQSYVAELYEEHNEDINKVMDLTSLPKTEIYSSIQFSQLRSLAKSQEILTLMDEQTKEKIYDKKIPITILERWFSRKEVKTEWGISFKEAEIILHKDKSSFLNAYGHLLRYILNNGLALKEFGEKVDTRFLNGDDNFQIVLKTLPKVVDSVTPEIITPIPSNITESTDTAVPVKPSATPKDLQPTPKAQKNNMKRARVAIKSSIISSSSAKLNILLSELKKVPVKTYPLANAIMLRVFLDLSVSDYFKENNYDKEIAKEQRCDFAKTTLKDRLTFLENKKIDGQYLLTPVTIKIIKKLKTPNNEHSLDTLNNYVHSHDTYKIDPQFICGFWDMLKPLLTELVGYQE